MCFFIVLMSSILICNVETILNKEKPLNEKVCPNFRLVLYVNSNLSMTFLILSRSRYQPSEKLYQSRAIETPFFFAMLWTIRYADYILK